MSTWRDGRIRDRLGLNEARGGLTTGTGKRPTIGRVVMSASKKPVALSLMFVLGAQAALAAAPAAAEK